MTERSIIRLLLKVGPWLTPVVTMFIVQRSLVRHFDLPEPVAWIGASVLEILGIASIYLWMSCNDWNRRHKDGRARSVLAGSLVAMYISATMTLVIVLDVVPNVERWALAILPMLSVVAYLALSIFSEMEQMEGEKQRAKDERKAARLQPAMQLQSAATRCNYDDFAEVQRTRNGDGMLTAAEIMERFGVSQRSAYYWREKYARGNHGLAQN